jgi:hypothetical protein
MKDVNIPPNVQTIHYTIYVGTVALGTVAMFLNVKLALLAPAFIFGWFQIGGVWGMALVGALTPLGKAAGNNWLKSAVVFTVAGCISAGTVGAFLGALGGLLRSNFLIYSVAPLGIILAGREWGLIQFPLPEQRRQTEKVWVHEFGFTMASAMWGFHLGMGFATYVTYGGFFILVATAVAVGDPGFGVTLMILYWLGRAMPVWVAPIAWPISVADELPQAILADRLFIRRSAAIALLWSACLAMLIVLKIQQL